MPLEFTTINNNIRRYSRSFMETTARVPGTRLVVWQAIYNYANNRVNDFSRIAFLNDLTSVRWVLAWRVDIALIGPYRETLEKLDDTTILPDNIGEKLIRQILSELPPDISQLCITVSEKSRRTLEQYYLNIGDAFIHEWLIRNSGYYTDGVTFHL